MALVMSMWLVLTNPLSLTVPQLLVHRLGGQLLPREGSEKESVLKSLKYGSGPRFWNELLFPLGLLYYKLRMSASTFQNVQTTEKQYFFFFCNSGCKT